MPSIDPAALPKRDARGRFLEAPGWLRPGWGRINAAGLGLGGALRKRCAFGDCRAVPVRGSDRCRMHDWHGQRRRSKELRTGKGKPMSVAESVKLFRANVQRLWRKAPWLPLTTIWLSSPLEQRFAEDCRRAGFDLAEISPFVANTWRWVWKRSVLDRRDDAAWQRGLDAGRKRQAKIGPPPEGYSHTPPADVPPDDPRIKQVHRRATAFDLAAQTGPIDRTTKAKQRKQQAQERRPPRRFDAVAFIAEHWQTVFRALFKSLHIDPAEIDAPIGHQLALAYYAVVEEQMRLGEAVYGPAHQRWVALLRSLK